MRPSPARLILRFALLWAGASSLIASRHFEAFLSCEGLEVFWKFANVEARRAARGGVNDVSLELYVGMSTNDIEQHLERCLERLGLLDLSNHRAIVRLRQRAALGDGAHARVGHGAVRFGITVQLRQNVRYGLAETFREIVLPDRRVLECMNGFLGFCQFEFRLLLGQARAEVFLCALRELQPRFALASLLVERVERGSVLCLLLARTSELLVERRQLAANVIRRHRSTILPNRRQERVGTAPGWHLVRQLAEQLESRGETYPPPARARVEIPQGQSSISVSLVVHASGTAALHAAGAS